MESQGKIQFDFSALLSILLFSAVYGYISFFLISFTNNLAYEVVFSMMLFVIYLNILRYFIFEFCTLTPSRVSEMSGYVIMYAITISVLTIPFFVEPIFVFESSVIRYVIIGFAILMLAKYTIFMILGPWHDIKMKIRHKLYFDHVDYNPLVTVMIPAWNEGEGVIHTIQSLLKSTYRNIEIVVINDGSTDDSEEKVCAFLKKHLTSSDKDISVRYRYQENGGKGAALNHAIAVSRGEILISIDADCVVDSKAIAEIVKVFKDPAVQGAVGNVKIGNRYSTVGIVQYLEFLFSFYFKRSDALLGTIYIIGGAAGAFRRSVFTQLGGYNTTNITEDIELTVRMQDAGMKIEYVSDAIVYTEAASDLASLKKQRLRWKRGRFQTFYQHMHLFFSTDKRHNKFLTWVIMPLAMIQEFQLLLEIPFLIFLYAFSILNSDFSSFLTGVVVVGMMFVIQFTFYDKSTRRLSFVALAPIGWLLFYMATYVEAWALIKSTESLVFGKEVVWQRWERKGVGKVAGIN